MLFEEKEFNIFTDFNEEEKQSFLAICSPESCSAGETILEEGQMTRSLYIIDEGEVSIGLEIEGQTVVLAEMKNHDFFGEMSFLDGKLHSATVKATKDTTFFIVRKFSFDIFAKKNPEISKKLYENIIKTLLCRLRNTNTIIRELKEDKN
ncbi:cyclic nucleotide-binding domain-containing protein [Candidatus Calescamantes bacterium]|nr:cyclic nucleotide-binding domain-containing protein [Candidatus Calescamantes bacterium]MCK5599112.1 cyclic nucleotide-binding domain-containing protein [bacterium]